jgi:hypothetical protein
MPRQKDDSIRLIAEYVLFVIAFVASKSLESLSDIRENLVNLFTILRSRRCGPNQICGRDRDNGFEACDEIIDLSRAPSKVLSNLSAVSFAEMSVSTIRSAGIVSPSSSSDLRMS